MRTPTRKQLDTSFPTFVRWAGVVIILYETFLDKVERPSLVVAATGMILFKSVLNGRGSTSEDDDDERWSHLP
jgi:hypothetical protein